MNESKVSSFLNATDRVNISGLELLESLVHPNVQKSTCYLLSSKNFGYFLSIEKSCNVSMAQSKLF